MDKALKKEYDKKKCDLDLLEQELVGKIDARKEYQATVCDHTIGFTKTQSLIGRITRLNGEITKSRKAIMVLKSRLTQIENV